MKYEGIDDCLMHKGAAAKGLHAVRETAYLLRNGMHRMRVLWKCLCRLQRELRKGLSCAGGKGLSHL